MDHDHHRCGPLTFANEEQAQQAVDILYAADRLFLRLFIGIALIHGGFAIAAPWLFDSWNGWAIAIGTLAVGVSCYSSLKIARDVVEIWRMRRIRALADNVS